MEIMITNSQDKIPFTKEMETMVEKVILCAARLEGREDGEVSVLITDNPFIHQLNLQYRGQDKPTDVLSFAMQERGEEEPDFLEEEADLLGDIVISLEQAFMQSREYGHSLERELGYLVAHGMLHLLGYDHEDEESRKIMRDKEERIMKELNLER
ncbi:probable rRNA maturation factor [Thermosyntropha lipolytica DSM 11003]|uniref:Endoribonuclease YbeY n=1 Tax=Thermosyntropha lipolytica DSM 11003 TaxID=1123382 RepID=A0A1M5N988_9FIRM|nr:rRNA maturation RNase YbeY [Thermosyntropha lipolytica]SHG86012.1 probable rRNA maturation factor [Thermosyntropha lipolytica DSM 11003]